MASAPNADGAAVAVSSGSPDAIAIDDETCQEERVLLREALALKAMLEEARKKAVDTDFYKMTEEVQELGRLKFKIRKHLRGHLAKVTQLHWAVDNQLMVSASQDGKVIVWDTYTTNKVHMIALKVAWVIGCAFAPSMGFVASGGLDNILSVYSLEGRDGSSKLVRELSGHNGYISSIRFLDDNRILTSSGDKTCALWDTKKSQITTSFVGHANDVNALALSRQDMNMFVSASSDKTCRVWDIRTNQCSQYFEGHVQDVNGVDFFPENSYAFVTSSDDGTCRLWDLRADQPIAIYIDDYIQCGSTSVAVSKSGRLLIAGYDDFNCHVWDILREERVGIMSAHDGRVSSVSICESGIGVATGSWDSTCLVWTAK